MNGQYLRDLEIEYNAALFDDIVGGWSVLLLWLVPGGFYGCGSASGMGRKYVLHFFAWIALTLWGMPSWSWYGICWTGGFIAFWASWWAWRSKMKTQAPGPHHPEDPPTITINL